MQHRERQKNPRRLRRLLIIILAAAAIAAAALAFLLLNSGNEDRTAYKKTRDVFLNNISIDGVALDGMTYPQAVDALSKHIEDWQKSWSLRVSCGGFTYATLNYAAAGLQADYEALENMLREAWALGHTGGYEQYLADAAALEASPYRGAAGVREEDATQIDYLLSVIQSSVYRAPIDAALLGFDASNPADPFAFRNEARGQTIDAAQAKADILALAASGQGGDYEVALVPLEPRVTLEEVRQKVSLLAVSTTAIDKFSTDSRNDNIALAFSRINGTVLEDGAKFSFNKLVGKRTERNGFLLALGYLSGELVETVGGGVCQASTTIYASALCAGMTFDRDSRTPHSIPVSYISLGQDATVNDTKGHEIDLTFRNKTGGRVYITCGIETNAAGRLECVARFFGQALPDGAYNRVESVIEEVLPIPEDVYRKDKDGKYVTYTNQKYKASSGAEGYVVKTYLQQYKDGTMISSTLVSTDTYKARPTIYYVGVTER